MAKGINKVMCPEDCAFVNKEVRFCGYCLKRIIEERKEKENAGRQE